MSVWLEVVLPAVGGFALGGALYLWLRWWQRRHTYWGDR